MANNTVSRYWWEESCSSAKELTDCNPTTALYWQGRALEGLGDVMGAMQAYETALSQHLLYPARTEVKEALKRLQTFASKSADS